MANLDFILSLKNKGKQDYLLTESISGKKAKKYLDLIRQSKGEEMVLMFVDITGFSTKMKNQDSEKIKEYLDEYYELILKIIDDHNGTVFQIIGDGILCFWGQPFSEGDEKSNRTSAILCAKELIEESSKGKYESKVALHEGKVFYHEIESSGHSEFTLTGTPITELFRLESVSKSNAINFFTEDDTNNTSMISVASIFRRVNLMDLESVFNELGANSNWISDKPVSVELKGVGKKKICSAIYKP